MAFLYFLRFLEVRLARIYFKLLEKAFIPFIVIDQQIYEIIWTNIFRCDLEHLRLVFWICSRYQLIKSFWKLDWNYLKFYFQKTVVIRILPFVNSRAFNWKIAASDYFGKKFHVAAVLWIWIRSDPHNFVRSGSASRTCRSGTVSVPRKPRMYIKFKFVVELKLMKNYWNCVIELFLLFIKTLGPDPEWYQFS
jgi:hypothetical protein